MGVVSKAVAYGKDSGNVEKKPGLEGLGPGTKDSEPFFVFFFFFFFFFLVLVE